jgi:hypothetical protein
MRLPLLDNFRTFGKFPFFPAFVAVLICSLSLAFSLSAQTGTEFVQHPFLARLSIEIDRQIRGFRHLPYEETNSLEPLDPQWRALGFIPFARAWGRSVYPNTIPAAEERGAPLESFAAPGESEPLVFGLRALESGISGLRVTAGGLVNIDTVGFIPPDSIQVGVVEHFRVRWGEGSGARAWRWHPTRIWPWGQFPGSPFCRADTSGLLWVRPNTAQHFWLTVRTPGDATPGNYSGSVFVESDQGYYRVPIHFTVLPVRLSARGLPPRGVIIPAPQDPFACRDLASHGINTVVRWYDPASLPAKVDKGEISFDFTLEDAFVARLAAAGIRGPQIIFAGSPASPVFDSTLALVAAVPPDSAWFDIVYAQAVQVILEHSRKQGWPRLFWGIFDRAGRSEQDLSVFQSRAGALRKVMGSGVNLTSPLINRHDKGLLEELAPFVNLWLAGEDVEIDGQIGDKAVWGYVAVTQRHSGAEARSRVGFIPWRKKMEGLVIWAYNWPGGGHAWNDFDSPRMDWMLSYRDIDDRYRATPAWEGVREGIEDRRYILTLENLLAAYSATHPEAEQARDFLAGLSSLIETEDELAAAIALPAESPTSNDNTPSGIARRAIAGHIIRLLKAY